jgi:recombination protein RecT
VTGLYGIKAYAIATTQAEGTMIKVMTAKEIEQRRNSSRAMNSPLWNEWTDEAWMKTVLRNLAKRLPSSSDLDDLIRRDDELYGFNEATPSNTVRITDVNSALDSFSGSGDLSNSNARSEPDRESSTTLSSEPTSLKNPESVSEADVAFERGVEAKRDGMARKAVPPEYREPDKSHLAKSWWSGWDYV